MGAVCGKQADTYWKRPSGSSESGEPPSKSGYLLIRSEARRGSMKGIVKSLSKSSTKASTDFGWHSLKVYTSFSSLGPLMRQSECLDPHQLSKGDGPLPLIGGRYQLLKLLGMNKTDWVYSATDKEMGSPVSVRILKSVAIEQILDILGAMERLQDTEGLWLPNEIFFANGHWISVENLAISNSRTVFASSQPARRSSVSSIPFSPLTVGRLGMLTVLAEEISRSLAAVHKLGLIHGEIRPEAFLLDQDGKWRLGGWRSPGRPIGSRTSPEILLGEVGGVAADFWSFGISLLELSTGKRWGAGSAADLVSRAERLNVTEIFTALIAQGGEASQEAFTFSEKVGNFLKLDPRDRVPWGSSTQLSLVQNKIPVSEPIPEKDEKQDDWDDYDYEASEEENTHVVLKN